METAVMYQEQSAAPLVTNETTTKVCRSCGRELPLSALNLHNKSEDGHCSECKECSRRRSRKAIAKNAKSNPLAQFTARELMVELKKRGYEGTLEYVQVHKINILEL